MNVKFGLVMGAAVACAVMTGCKAPKAQAPSGTTKIEPSRPAHSTEVVIVDERPEQKESKPTAPAKAPESVRCMCAPGTVHDTPCMCGAPNCKCKVKAPEPEYTIYRVKSGDMLSAICKRYSLRQKKVLELNPGLDPNKLYAGRKIKLPGTIDVSDGGAPAASAKPAVPAKPVAKPAAASAGAVATKPSPAKAIKEPARASSYKGATKEYAVKSGDSLGKIAAENGITIKCLKDMNGLKNNNIRIGQKLKVPAEKPVAEAPRAEAKTDAAAAPAEAPKADDVKAKPEASAPAAPQAEPAAATPEEKPAESTAAVEQVQATSAALESGEVKTHTVKDGEDIVSIAILYNVSPSAIMDLNDLKNADSITPGRVLKLPASAKMQ